MSDEQDRSDPAGTAFDWDVGELYIMIGDRTHDTGLVGHWDGECFVVPFHDDGMTVEEVARIVSQALRRRFIVH